MANGRDSLNKIGCEFGRLIKKDVDTLKKDIKEINVSMKEISNHYSQRLPNWAHALGWIAAVIIGSLATLITL